MERKGGGTTSVSTTAHWMNGVGGESSSVFCFLAHCEETKQNKNQCVHSSEAVEAGTPANPPQALYHNGGVEGLVTSYPTHSP